MTDAPGFVHWFDSIRLDDVPAVGGKNASLGEMVREMGSQGVRVPNGFALTVRAYYDALRGSGAEKELRRLMDGVDGVDVELLEKRGAQARQIVYDSTGTDALRREIAAA